MTDKDRKTLARVTSALEELAEAAMEHGNRLSAERIGDRGFWHDAGSLLMGLRVSLAVQFGAAERCPVVADVAPLSDWATMPSRCPGCEHRYCACYSEELDALGGLDNGR